MCARACVCVAYVYGGQRPTSGAVPQDVVPVVFETGALTDLGLAELDRLLASSEVSLSSPAHCVFIPEFRDQTQASCLHSNHFAD